MDVELSPDTREALDEHSLSPLWEVEEDELGAERTDLEPEIWKWADLKATADAIEADVPIEDLPPGFRRRVVVPTNPAYGAAISHSIYVGVQTVSPGETAPSHRHGANAMRFAIDGHEGLRTVVGGEEFPMLDNDLVTTPQWEWHDHVNDSDETAVWLDVLDLPLVFNSLNVGNVFEDHSETRQEVDRPRGFHESWYGTVRPAGGDDGGIPGPFEGTREPTPPYRFGWDDCREALEYAADAGETDPHDGVCLDYANPATGRAHLFPTFGVRAQRLDGETAAHRHNATEVYYVVGGSGVTAVDGAELHWDERDIFVVPPNATHGHRADGEATLLSVHDRPILESINFYHEVDES